MKEYGPKTKLAALDWFQNRAPVHPLTCGNDSKHQNLVGRQTESGVVYLECMDCNYIQDWFPEYVVEFWLKTMAFGVSRLGTPAGTFTHNMGQ